MRDPLHRCAGRSRDSFGACSRWEFAVLTVGESARFTKLGGIIRLYKENEKLRFEINVSRAQLAGLRISSKMLGLAKITKEAS